MSPSRSINAILIANRGEIASRIIRTCRSLGIRAIAVYSEADREAPFVSEADEAIALGGNAPGESYLDQDKLIAAAKRTGAEAIHPGYGFLSENAGFAQRVKDEGLIFIGPSPEAIAAMGSKATAKALVEAHGVPTIPGYRGEDQSPNRLQAEALEIGFPLLLKAVAGGGGKGMRIVRHEKELLGAIEAAKSEARNAFGDDSLLLEKYFSSVRHIEFQIFGDQQGHVLHLLERECTIQRRYQKIMEESPSPALDEALRAKMGAAAIAAAKALAYQNAGTVEFILDTSDPQRGFYFLEVNTRLQVEHPVTEAITGLDLVALQIAVAEGKPLPLTQAEVQGKGYALEMRLYAEDPAKDFMPATGTVHQWRLPAAEGIRVDSGIREGSAITVYYDPMVAKLIAHGPDRATAHRRMQRFLYNMRCLGPTTNRRFLADLLADAEVQEGRYDTHFLQGWQPAALSPEKAEAQQHAVLIAATLHRWRQRETARTLLPAIPSGWRNSFSQRQFEELHLDGEDHVVHYRDLGDSFEVEIGGKEMRVRFEEEGGEMALEIDGHRQKIALVQVGADIYTQVDGREYKVVLRERFPVQAAEENGGGYVAPMPSQVLKVLVEPGQEVRAGDSLLVLVSMKMENTIAASTDGRIGEVYVEAGQNIEAGAPLLEFLASEETMEA